MSKKLSRSKQMKHWQAVAVALIFASPAHAAQQPQGQQTSQPVQSQKTENLQGQVTAEEEESLPTLMTDSNETPVTVLEYTHPLLPDGYITDTPTTRNRLGDLVTRDKNEWVLGAPLPDDSYIISDAPTAFSQEISLCSDQEFVTALKAGGTTSKATGFNTIPHDADITLANGCVMFAPSVDTRVTTPKGIVMLEKNSLAVVVCDNSHLSVYDINDDHKGSVTLQAEGNTIALAPGRHVTVTHGKIAEFRDINPIQAILHKGVSSHKVGDQSKAFVSNFSILSAINALQPLGALMQSDHNEAKKVASKILKTSSILMQIDNNGVPYAFHAKKRSVALNSVLQ